jgi:4-hydroxy-tetrahydrodipicolinate reductase
MVEAKALGRGHSIVTVVNEHHAGLDASDLAESLRAADVAIDFSAAAAVLRNVEACMAANLPVVEGTTGWHEEMDEVRELVTSSEGSFVFGANFSIGVNLFYQIVDHATELLAKFPEYEVFIEEQHHSQKKDAPSGTALKLKEIVSEHVEGDIAVSSTRAGHIPGTHRVGFDGTAEQIMIEHVARSRECFAVGALIAAEWIESRTGFYRFREVMEDIIRKR